MRWIEYNREKVIVQQPRALAALTEREREITGKNTGQLRKNAYIMEGSI